MVAGLLLSETVCFDHWKKHLPLGRCLAFSWQRRCQRFFANRRIDVEALYGPLILWATQHWHQTGQSLHLALDTTVLDNRFCGTAITLLADRGVPSSELLGWFEGRARWGYVMRLRSDTWIDGTAAPLGCEVRNLQLQEGQYRSHNPWLTDTSWKSLQKHGSQLMG